MPETILVVDDEKDILSSIVRLLIDLDLDILTAGSAREALDILATHKVALIISDHRMPGMTGVEMLTRAKRLAPDTIKILMTAHADLNLVIDAINQAEIFRILLKPWDNDKFVTMVKDAIDRYQVVQSLVNGDEKTLLSLAQTIELKDPYTKGHCERVANFAVGIGSKLKLPKELLKDLRYGGWLHDCGKIGVPEDILNQPGALDDQQMATVRKHPEWGAEVARQANLPKTVVNIILHHHERFDGHGYPHGLKAEDIPLEARVVALADAYDAMTSDRPYSKAFSIEKALTIMTGMAGQAYDPALLGLLQDVVRESPGQFQAGIAAEL
jgi:putative nucleotidyltransferase with HDIG domain